MVFRRLCVCSFIYAWLLGCLCVFTRLCVCVVDGCVQLSWLFSCIIAIFYLCFLFVYLYCIMLYYIDCLIVRVLDWMYLFIIITISIIWLCCCAWLLDGWNDLLTDDNYEDTFVFFTISWRYFFCSSTYVWLSVSCWAMPLLMWENGVEKSKQNFSEIYPTFLLQWVNQENN